PLPGCRSGHARAAGLCHRPSAGGGPAGPEGDDPVGRSGWRTCRASRHRLMDRVGYGVYPHADPDPGRPRGPRLRREDPGAEPERDAQDRHAGRRDLGDRQWRSRGRAGFTMTSSGPVAVSGLGKRFEETVALDDVSFEVRPAELFGLVGPDGGGKTTLFRILATLLLPDNGSATVLGLDVSKDLWALRSRIGYMPGHCSLYPDLSVEENLEFFAAVFGTTVAAGHHSIAPIYRQIEPFRERRAADLSGGMKQKLALSCALVHRPEILFLDEPTTGVDAVSRREFWDLLHDLRASGLTIVVSTPYMD